MNKLFCLATVLFGLVALTSAQGYGYYSIPLCFPNGWIKNEIPPRGLCYRTGFPGSIPPSRTPCLPPILYNGIMPPCEGSFYLLSTQTYRNLANYYNYNKYSNIISNGFAHLRMCFPDDFHDPNPPKGLCYNPGFRGSIPTSAGTCLPPKVRENLIPPCEGTYFSLRITNYAEFAGFSSRPHF